MRILVAGGASGGHIFPALAFIDSLAGRHPHCRTLLVIPRTKAQLDAALEGYRLMRVDAVTVGPRPDGRLIVACARLIKVCAQSVRALLRFKPDLVVGFGSVTSVPLLFFAWIFRLRTAIHEQNVVPGKATKLLSLCADKVCLSFDQTRAFLPWARRKCVVTGNPLRASLVPVGRQQACAFFSFDPGLPTVLVMGGSQGSVTINQAVPAALARACAGRRLQVIHLCGSQNEVPAVEKCFRDAGIRAAVMPFLTQMQQAYSACDLVVSRAGATSIAELMFFSKPCILIPYPYAGAHQLQNARVLAERGCARIVGDSEVSLQLSGVFDELLGDAAARSRMSAAYAQWGGRSSTTLFTDEVLHG